jgi:predicted metalloprotease with PDZ domain
MLNIEIIKGSDAERSLDDALRMLYGDYKMDSTRGFTDERVKEICETASGKNLDEFWRKYIDGTDELPLESYLKICGLEMTNENDTIRSSLDIQSKTQGESLVIEKVFAGGTAYESGLNAKDEILAIDGIRVNSGNLKEVLKYYSEGDEANALISRSGFIKEIKLKFLKPMPKYKIKETEDINDEQRKYLEKWLVG